MRIVIRTLAALALLSTAAYAGEGEHAVVYAGQYDALKHKDTAVVGGLEYRFKDQFNGLRPVVGVMGTSDSAFYLYGGAYWDLPLNTAPFVITPGLAAGAYGNGHGKDLGYGLEFRSTIEVAYEFEGGDRLGLGLSHLSNASLGDDNPGVEPVQLVYSRAMW